MFQNIQISSRYGTFELLINEEDLDITKPKLYVNKHRWGRNAFHFIPIVLKNGRNQDGRDHRFLHLVIAERCLNRPLKKGELVHHLNGDKFDCRRSNLLICTFSKHGYLHTRMSVEYAKINFQSPLSGDQLQLLHRLLDRNTQDISGAHLAL